MKHKLLVFFLFITAISFAEVASASTVVTFDAAVDMTGGNAQNENLSITKGGVTLACSYGNFGDGKCYRFYKSSSVVISCGATSIITSISFTASTYTGYPLSGLSANTGTYDGSNGSWTATSDVNSVTFTPSAQVRAAVVEVTIDDLGTTDYRPTLTDGFTFWPVMDATTATAQVTITPKAGTLVYYTTDGSNPTTSSTRITQTTTITINGTTTVKAGRYNSSTGSVVDIVERTYVQGKTYNGAADVLTNAADNEDVRLFWSDEMNARVTYAHGSQTFIRDNTGAILFFGVEGKPKFAKNQHIAGWIKGRVTVYGGFREFSPTELTNCNELVIAEPVTEPEVEPKVISTVEDFDNSHWDLVTLRNVRYDEANPSSGSYDNGKEIKLYNRFYLSNWAYPYNGALVDLTGMAIPYNYARQIAATDMQSYYTYVINQDSLFTPPTQILRGVNGRLQMQMNADSYYLLVTPFDIYSEDHGTLYAYNSTARDNDGNYVVNFTTASEISGGDVYLFKPNFNMDGFTMAGVDLYNYSADNTGILTDDDCRIKGVYEPLDAEVGSFVMLPDATLHKVSTTYDNYGYLPTASAYLTGSFVNESKVYISIDGEVIGKATIRGDLNGDGFVNTGDVSTLYTALLAGSTDPLYDLNGDGFVNTGDVSTLYTIILGGGQNNVIVKPVNAK